MSLEEQADEFAEKMIKRKKEEIKQAYITGYNASEQRIHELESHLESQKGRIKELRYIEDRYHELRAKGQWHDLRKDPTDLPKKNDELTDRSDVVITDKGIAHYNFRKQKWYVHNFECDMSFSESIIAWCEIPTFLDKA